MNEYIVIPEHTSLEKARKNVIYGTDRPFLDELGTVSEWAVVAAFQHYKVGQSVPWDEFQKTVTECQTQQSLDRLVELGLIEAVWDKDGIGYRAKR